MHQITSSSSFKRRTAGGRQMAAGSASRRPRQRASQHNAQTFDSIDADRRAGHDALVEQKIRAVLHAGIAIARAEAERTTARIRSPHAKAWTKLSGLPGSSHRTVSLTLRFAGS